MVRDGDVVRLEVDPAGLSIPKPWEYAVRFLFGGGVAVIASLASGALGDFAGGLALAFPGILPAALIGMLAGTAVAGGGWWLSYGRRG